MLTVRTPVINLITYLHGQLCKGIIHLRLIWDMGCHNDRLAPAVSVSYTHLLFNAIINIGNIHIGTQIIQIALYIHLQLQLLIVTFQAHII